MKKIFVYGTLLEGCRNYNIYLKHHVRSIQKAYVKGLLYSIKNCDYPALIEGNRYICGEIMAVDDSVISLLDDLEGFYKDNSFENEYNKEYRFIYDQYGKCIAHLPVYFYNLTNPKLKDTLDQLIEENDYRIWLKQYKR